VLYGRNLPESSTRTRSPFSFASRAMSIEKSMALMMPSPNSSWISSLIRGSVDVDDLVPAVDQRIGRYRRGQRTLVRHRLQEQHCFLGQVEQPRHGLRLLL